MISFALLQSPAMHLVTFVVDESVDKGRQTDKRKVAMFMLLLVAFLLT